jgi:hypothetical protein
MNVGLCAHGLFVVIMKGLGIAGNLTPNLDLGVSGR